MTNSGLKAVLDKIKNIPIVEIAKKLGIDVSSFTKVGLNLTGKCPTGHKSSSNKSFHITPSLNLYHCWNCGIGGDNVQLVIDVKGTHFIGAVEWIMSEFNIPGNLSNLNVPKRTKEDIEEEKRKKINTILYEELIIWGKDLLYNQHKKYPKALEAYYYLTSYRNYNESILKQTDFFFIPSEKEAKEFLLKKLPEYQNYIQNLKIAGGGYNDEMKINLPYRLSDGTISGLAKRHASPKGLQTPSGKPARWDTTPGLRRKDLYGAAGLKRNFRKAPNIIIVEGYPDAEYLQAAGLPVIAFGSGLPSKEQLDSLINLNLTNLKTIKLALDGDEAGINNTINILFKLSSRSNYVIEVLPHDVLESSKDLDEFFRKEGLQKTQQIINTKTVLGIYWYMNYLKEAYNGIIPIHSIEDIIDLIANSPEVVKSLASKKIKSALNISQADLNKHILNSETKRWSNLYQLESYINPILKWPKVPFISKDGYGIYDRTKIISEIDDMSMEEINKMVNASKIFISPKGKSHIMDLLSADMALPPILPNLEIVYDPQNFYEIDIKKRLINTFTPTRWMYYEKNNEIINPIQDFPGIYKYLVYIVSNTDDIDVRYLINWISTIFNRREKLRTSIHFVGTQGSGKNVFIDHIIRRLFGFYNVTVVGSNELESPYNSYLGDKLFVVFNELDPYVESKKSVKGKIKGIITDPVYIYNEKYRPIKERISYANTIFISNPITSQAIDMDDRRLTMIKMPNTKLQESSYFKEMGWSPFDFQKFVDTIKKEFPKFVQYLKNYDYDYDLANTAIMNSIKQHVIDSTTTIFDKFARLLINRDKDELEFMQLDGTVYAEENPIIWDDEHVEQGIIECNVALNLINKISGFNKPITMKMLTVKLAEHDITKKRLRIECEWKHSKNDRHYFYILPD